MNGYTTYLVIGTWGEKKFAQHVNMPEVGIPAEKEIEMAESIGMRLICSFNSVNERDADEVSTVKV